ncbi:DUF6382 domain-containing protein [Ruminococcus sp. HUN007]|uniref:DUF6382 domain-containing protein n=1 Tax=Ruminococcus sp. HUN007 TaxID=1514668 RepID=UPI0005D1C0C0|nr:DUF6382 domain-containing protein [Ruminococcus sp. HUN007]
MRSYIKNDERKNYFIIESDAGAVLDTVAQGMLENNDIAGMLPFSVMHFDDVTTVRYDVTPFITLSEMLERTVTKKEILSVISTVTEAMALCPDYMISSGSVILEADKMFYDEENGRLHLCVFPFVTTERESVQTKDFLKNFICRVKFDSTENCDYIGKILGALNDDTCDTEFIRRIADENSCENLNSVQNCTPENNVQLAETSFENHQVNNFSENNSENSDSFRNESSCPVSALDSFADEEMEEDSSIKGFFSGFLGRKNKIQKNPAGISTDESADDDALMAGFSDGKEGYFNREKDRNGTVVLGSRSGHTAPVLIRLSNDERIEIKGKRFRIGSDSRTSDYCITDNCAVSRAHADIINKKGVLYITDNNSTNHTYLDDQELKGKKEYRLSNNSRITLADEEFRLSL